MPEALEPAAFAAKLNAWKHGTMIASHGTHFLTAGQGRTVACLDFKPELTQLTGLFHAGAIIALADEAATAAAMWGTNPTGELKPELFPLTLQLSVNLMRNTNHGVLTAEAHIMHRGRTTMVTEVKVRDDRHRLIATVGTTALIPAAVRQ